VLKLDPGNQEALLLRGSLYYNDKQLDRAIADLTETIRLFPDDPTAYQLLAEALLKKGDIGGAMEEVAMALKKDSSFVPAYITMGDIHVADSHIDRAVEAYSRALNIDPNNFDARVRRAKLYMEVNNFTQAVADLEHAAKVNAYSGEVYELRARCYETLGDKEKARQDQWKARVFAHR